MPHIHKEVENGHDPTASAYIVVDDGKQEPRLFLHAHKKLGFLLQIGGHVDPHENPWMAIGHELPEESGYDFADLLLAQPKQRLAALTGVNLLPQPAYELDHYFPGIEPAHYHFDRGYLFIAHALPQRAPMDGESVDFRLFTLPELAALDEDSILPNVQEIGMYCLTLYANLEASGWELVDPATFSRELPPEIVQ
jgi:8-oxo-dGTP pyrophosphatase MutT (NUDIX family)